MPRPRTIPDAPPSHAPRGVADLIVNQAHYRRVVRDGILTARTSLAVMTADLKAVHVPDEDTRRSRSIIDVFAALAGRGVEIRVLHSGVPSGPVLDALRDGLPAGVTLRRCPRVHAKAVVIDCAAMYLGSANLTGAGLGAKADNRRNFEMGIWTRQPELIDAVLEQFDALWEGRRCPACARRDVCPAPLEEPDLS
jgi:phosphatidylserine/phosphatidylglycerophosphate/cardiolipin synthase-like enzyme